MYRMISKEPLGQRFGRGLCPLHSSPRTLLSSQFCSLSPSPPPESQPETVRNTEVASDILDPADVYRELRRCEDSFEKLSDVQKKTRVKILHSFTKITWVSSQAFAAYTPTSFYRPVAGKFRFFFLSRCPPHVFRHLSSRGSSPEANRFLLPIFIDYCLKKFPEDLRHYKSLMEFADMQELVENNNAEINLGEKTRRHHENNQDKEEEDKSNH
ncbi:hypothetical protein KSP40_PGU019452 [Platanthera guangdongensis]|uniref:DExH18 N-terminal domain-containing protein n=1 Tax=Platanthera guangdongensis TaxID=2320717 RepID=A0ABR2MDY4_9ASPA